MIGLPPFGARVKVWPKPGRLVQLDHRPVDRWAGGRWMPSDGCELDWGTFQMEQLLAGDIMFHAPRKEAAREEKKVEPFDHTAEGRAHLKSLEPAKADAKPLAEKE